MHSPDSIDLAAANEALVGTRFAGYVQHFSLVDSTNDLALHSAQTGAQSGVWVADEQTAGRGRGGHIWHSTAGEGLYVSVLITPQMWAEQALLLSLAAGLATQSAIEETCGMQIDLRWPNDLMLKGKKCGGILVETALDPAAGGQRSMLRYAVIGIGINVNHAAFPPELSTLATSLRIETGVTLVRQQLLIALLKALDHEIDLLEKQYRGAVNGRETRERFMAASSWVLGKRVHVPEQGGYTGRTAGLDDRGFLLVDADDGVRRTVFSGGVREAL